MSRHAHQQSKGCSWFISFTRIAHAFPINTAIRGCVLNPGSWRTLGELVAVETAQFPPHSKSWPVYYSPQLYNGLGFGFMDFFIGLSSLHVLISRLGTRLWECAEFGCSLIFHWSYTAQKSHLGAKVHKLDPQHGSTGSCIWNYGSILLSKCA